MKRPFPVTLTLWAVLILMTWNLARLWTFIAWRGILTEFSVSLPPVVGAVIAGMWVLAGAILYWNVWQGNPRAGKMLLAAAAGYTVWYWGERFFFLNPQTNLWFAVITNLALLVLVFFANKSLSKRDT
jgi:hypothetical protein